jgi:hypothetical protein
MEYLYEQQALPNNVIGVKVHLTALDPNNNTEDLGSVTSDESGIFHLDWTPPVPGEYVVKADFAGSASYGPSSAKSALVVYKAQTAAAASPQPVKTAAPTATPTQVPTPTAPAQTVAPTPSPVVVPPTNAAPTATYIAIGAVIIIIIAAAAALILRRRK